MKQNYFLSNGEKYYTGTVFLALHNGKPIDATFIYYDTDYRKFLYKINSCTYVVSENEFGKRFIAVTDKVDNTVNPPIKKRMKDIEIEGLFFGWMWYIFLMSISLIFNGKIYLWILISLVFFSWRANKIEKEGTYFEW